MVTAFQVIEHIPDIKSSVKNISKLVKKNGFFIGSAPFVYPIHGKADYFRFTYMGLDYLLSTSFKKVKIIPYGNQIINVGILCKKIPVIGWFFNIFAKSIEKIFKKSNKISPTSYFFICSH